MPKGVLRVRFRACKLQLGVGRIHDARDLRTANGIRIDQAAPSPPPQLTLKLRLMALAG